MPELKAFRNMSHVILYCPYCKAKSSNYVTYIGQKTEKSESDKPRVAFFLARCDACEKAAVYVEKSEIVSDAKSAIPGVGPSTLYRKVLYRKMIYPAQIINPKIPKPSEYMPDDVKNLYVEAARVYDLSPRSSGALIRLALEKFLKKYIFGGKNKRLDDMIGELSANYPDYIIKLMDNIRNTGNSNVHEKISQLKINENKKDVLDLFSFIDMICKLLDTLKQSEKIFDKASEGQKQHIKQRNAKNKIANS